MGRKVIAVVSTGVRRMGQGEEGRKFFLPNDTRSERIITGGCVPCAVHHGASGQIFLGDVDKLGGGETVLLSYIEITSKNQGGSANMVPCQNQAPIRNVYKKLRNSHRWPWPFFFLFFHFHSLVIL
jgi:hypothetical protein